jgi:hypothetical protein
MRDDELDRFKSDIHFLHFAADRYGYERDRRKSSVASHVLRHPATDDKIVVRKDKDGHWTYFSVRDDRDHGTIIDFVQRRGRHVSLGSVREELRRWLGTARPVPEYDLPRTGRTVSRSPAEAFAAARTAATSLYLTERGLLPETLRDPRFASTWRLDARGNVLFVHRDEAGAVTGYEIKGYDFTGFAAGGTKTAWRSVAREDDRRLVVTETAIDALSYHQLHPGQQAAYLSTAGAPSRAQVEMLRRICARLSPGSTLVAAFDADAAGDKLAARVESLTRGLDHVAFARHAPAGAKDWNDVLRRIERDRLRSLTGHAHERMGPER